MENELNIYLDTIVFRIQKFGGASTYWKELVINFIKYAHVNLVVQSADLDKLNSDGQSVFKQIKNLENFIVEDNLPTSILRYLPFTKRLPPKSIYHSSYYRTCFQRSVVNIFTIHDFTHKKGYASKFPRKLVHIGLTSLGLRNADGIICISENTKKDLLHYYPFISEDSIRVIYHGVSDNYYPLLKNYDQTFRGLFQLDNDFVVFVGKRDGYKKFEVVAKALKELTSFKLIIVGGGPFSESELINLEINLKNRFFKIDDVNNNELNILYNYAYALIYPSIYEGFGFPVIEAMRAGCPVITTNLSSIPEVAGEAAFYMDEISSEGVIKQMNKLKNSNVREKMIKEGFEQSKKFSWEKCFEETFDFYKATYKKKIN